MLISSRKKARKLKPLNYRDRLYRQRGINFILRIEIVKMIKVTDLKVGDTFLADLPSWQLWEVTSTPVIDENNNDMVCFEVVSADGVMDVKTDIISFHKTRHVDIV
jgi:hypothetical protein